MLITIISVGKKHEEGIDSLILEYERRILHISKRAVTIDWKFLPHSKLPGGEAVNEESKAIMDCLEGVSSSDGRVILLDERGKEMDSKGFALVLEKFQIDSVKSLIFIIGGAYGVSDDLKKKANSTISLSKMVFPHQIVRLILVEQIYRAISINAGGAYHHG